MDRIQGWRFDEKALRASVIRTIHSSCTGIGDGLKSTIHIKDISSLQVMKVMLMPGTRDVLCQ